MTAKTWQEQYAEYEALLEKETGDSLHVACNRQETWSQDLVKDHTPGFLHFVS